MIHHATSAFWDGYQRLPSTIQQIADKNYELLKQDPDHPSLHFKKVGEYRSEKQKRFQKAEKVPGTEKQKRFQSRKGSRNRKSEYRGMFLLFRPVRHSRKTKVIYLERKTFRRIFSDFQNCRLSFSNMGLNSG